VSYFLSLSVPLKVVKITRNRVGPLQVAVVLLLSVTFSRWGVSKKGMLDSLAAKKTVTLWSVQHLSTIFNASPVYVVDCFLIYHPVLLFESKNSVNNSNMNNTTDDHYQNQYQQHHPQRMASIIESRKYNYYYYYDL
jgi:hypothetical protein